MNDVFTGDVFEIAKEFQWEIGRIEDPIEAALEANRALDTLNRISDARLQAGTHIVVHADGAYAIKQWDEEEQKHITLQYDPLSAEGETAGIGFAQNMVGELKLQTIFYAIRDSKIIEIILNDNMPEMRVSTHSIPRLMIPILQIDSVELAA
jgi:hypothetical protein